MVFKGCSIRKVEKHGLKAKSHWIEFHMGSSDSNWVLPIIAYGIVLHHFEEDLFLRRNWHHLKPHNKWPQMSQPPLQTAGWCEWFSDPRVKSKMTWEVVEVKALANNSVLCVLFSKQNYHMLEGKGSKLLVMSSKRSLLMNILLLGSPGATQSGMRKRISTNLFGLFTRHFVSCKRWQTRASVPCRDMGKESEYSALQQCWEELCYWWCVFKWLYFL